MPENSGSRRELRQLAEGQATPETRVLRSGLRGLLRPHLGRAEGCWLLEGGWPVEGSFSLTRCKHAQTS
jgi:hypothetical protein